MKPSIRAIVIGAVLSVVLTTCCAQELSPRAYWPAPRGSMVAVFGYSYNWGDILTDPSLPITGVDSRINTGFLGYLQTLSLLDRTANLVFELSYTWGTTSADVDGEPMRDAVSGITDLGITLSVNLFGAPSMNPEEFQQLRADPDPILGASVKVLVPIGTYNAQKIINVGANRWAVKPELGFTLPITPKWLLELEVGAWLFGDNDDFLGVRREQKPVIAAELHLVRRFTPGFWA
ncbi:MAG: transporter, partial [Bacteroidota bacterium]